MNQLSPREVDHFGISSSPEFRELVDKRRRFVLLAMGLSSLWFVIFLLLTAYGHAFMQHIIVPGLSVAYVLALSQYVMIWGVTAAYLRISRRTLDPLQARVVASAQRAGLEMQS